VSARCVRQEQALKKQSQRLTAVPMKMTVFDKRALENPAPSWSSVVAPAGRQAYLGELAWVAIAQGATFLGGLATVKVAASILGPAEYGKLSVGLAVVGVVQVCLYGAISQTAMRFFAFANAQKQHTEYKRALMKLTGAAAAFVFSAAILASLFGLQRVTSVPVAVLVAYAIINGTQMVAVAVCNAARKRDLVGIVQTSEAFIRPLLIVAVTYFTIASAFHTAIAYLISTCLVVSIFVALWAAKEGTAPRSEQYSPQANESVTSESLAWSMMTFAAPFVIFAVLGVIGSHGERLLLAKWASWSEVGSYALMMQLVMAPNLLFTAVINQFYFPLVFQLDPTGTHNMARGFRMYLLVSVLGVTAITTIIALFAPLIILMFSTPAFLGHEHLLWFLGPSAGLFCIAQQLVLPGLRLNRPAVYMPAKLIHSLALLGPSLVLVPKWGIDGMGVASLTASVAYLIAMLLANVRLNRDLKQTVPAEVEG
jgi:O-antigen/teichoic acid export membrane protein